MNVCTDFPNSQAVQVVFISTNPKKAGSSRTFPSSAPCEGGDSSSSPSSLRGSQRPPMAVDLCLPFIQNPIQQTQRHRAVPPPVHSVGVHRKTGTSASAGGLLVLRWADVPQSVEDYCQQTRLKLTCVRSQGTSKAFVLAPVSQ